MATPAALNHSSANLLATLQPENSSHAILAMSLLSLSPAINNAVLRTRRHLLSRVYKYGHGLVYLYI